MFPKFLLKDFNAIPCEDQHQTSVNINQSTYSLIYEKFCVGPWMVGYLNNHLKFQNWWKNNKNLDYTLFAGVPMATSDA